MTLEKIIKELEKRYKYLEDKESEINDKLRRVRLFEKPFCNMSNSEIDKNIEIYRLLLKKEKPYKERLKPIQDEKRIIREMLYVNDIIL